MWTFFAEHIFGILSGVLGLGAVGVGVSIFAFGIPAVVIMSKAADFFRAIVQFFSTPLGQAIGIVAICAVCLFIGDIHRARVDAKIWNQKETALNRAWQDKINQAAAAFSTARQIRDKNVDADIEQVVREKAAEIETLQNKVSTYENAPPSNCVLSPADLDSLRNDAGTTAPTVAKPTRKRRWNPFGNGR